MFKSLLTIGLILSTNSIAINQRKYAQNNPNYRTGDLINVNTGNNEAYFDNEYITLEISQWSDRGSYFKADNVLEIGHLYKLEWSPAPAYGSRFSDNQIYIINAQDNNYTNGQVVVNSYNNASFYSAYNGGTSYNGLAYFMAYDTSLLIYKSSTGVIQNVFYQFKLIDVNYDTYITAYNEGKTNGLKENSIITNLNEFTWRQGVNGALINDDIIEPTGALNASNWLKTHQTTTQIIGYYKNEYTKDALGITKAYTYNVGDGVKSIKVVLNGLDLDSNNEVYIGIPINNPYFNTNQTWTINLYDLIYSETAAIDGTTTYLGGNSTKYPNTPRFNLSGNGYGLTSIILYVDTNYQSNFKLSGMTDNYGSGYNLGYNDGKEYGYTIGYNDAKVIEYGRGYSEGLASPRTNSPIDMVFDTFIKIGGFMSIEVFPNITIGLLVSLPLVFGLIMFIVKIVKGG